MNRILIFLAFLILFCTAGTSQLNDRKYRQVITSPSFPKVEIEVSSELSYLGTVSFDVGDRAKAEEFIFGEKKNGKLGRTFIVHFEYFLPSNSFQFNYPRFRMMQLGQHEYLHQIFYVKNFELVKNEAWLDLLITNGLTAEKDWLMNRYVRAVDPEKKHELIFFYLEPDSMIPDTIKSLTPKDPRSIEMDNWEKGLAERATRLFKIIED